MPEQAGQVYRWRMVQASTMKWMDLSFNSTGCHFGIYSRDGNFLRDFPRLTDHIVMSAANRSFSLPPLPAGRLGSSSVRHLLESLPHF